LLGSVADGQRLWARAGKAGTGGDQSGDSDASRVVAVTDDAGLVFDRVAEEYDRVRPGYPAFLVDTACSTARLRAGSRVLEVGCGTGKLTDALVERGLHVDAVDPGPQLVEVARRRLAGSTVRFHVGRFEDVELPAAAFEAVFSATAFHWVDPAVGWAKAARLLRPEGVLVLLTHVGGSFLELDADFLAAWREVLPDAQTWVSRDAQTLWEGAEARRTNVSELWAWLVKREIARPEAAELFGDVRLTTLPIEREETSAESLAHIRTASAYLLLDSDRQERLEKRLAAVIEDRGGSWRSTTFATLVTARLSDAG
jgi:ubiquinone/menaquinone biosynthesis C-methylase UbiE